MLLWFCGKTKLLKPYSFLYILIFVSFNCLPSIHYQRPFRIILLTTHIATIKWLIFDANPLLFGYLSKCSLKCYLKSKSWKVHVRAYWENQIGKLFNENLRRVFASFERQYIFTLHVSWHDYTKLIFTFNSTS